MVPDGGAPSKRLRTSYHPPTSESIATTNAHLHAVAPARHKWMSGSDARTVASYGANLNHNASAQIALPQNSLFSREDGDGVHGVTSTHSSTSNTAIQQQQHVPGRSSLVEYQLPEASASLGTNSRGVVNLAGANGRNDVSARSSLPGLPSPAPSDENRNSPIEGNSLHQQFQHPQNFRSNGLSSMAHSIVPSNSNQLRRVGPHSAARNEFGMPLGTLHKTIDEAEARIRAKGVLLSIDLQRLEMLRAAVTKSDYFYLTLSQLSCLKTTSPNVLPRSICGVSDDSYHFLGKLIHPNTAVNHDLLLFFSDFPEPLMAVYSGPARDEFEMRVRQVKTFLQKLPVHWNQLATSCRSFPSPPLPQDLDEALHLQSYTLQKITFRSMAAWFFDFLQRDPKGRAMVAIDKLFDVNWYAYTSLRCVRSASEKREAYSRLKGLFASWHAESQRLGDEAVYTIPQETTDHLLQPPQSIQRQQQQEQRQLQQLHHLQQQRQQPYQPHPPHQPPPQVHTQLPQHSQYRPLGNRFQYHQVPPQGSFQEAQAPRFSPANPYAPFSPTPIFQQHQYWTPAGPTVRTTMQTDRTKEVSRNLFPRDSDPPRPQPAQPNPIESALHQAHLRSPVIGPRASVKDGSGLYQYLMGFALPPRQVNRALPSQFMAFQIGPKLWARVAKEQPSSEPGGPSRRILDEDSFTFRLRCCAMPPNGFAFEHAWVTADSSWPDNYYFEVNGHTLETRRKLHYGRYLPVDLTTLVKEGRNEIRVFRTEPIPSDRSGYVVAIEAIGVKSHHDITKTITRIPADTSLDSIKKSLSVSELESHDEEISMTSNSLTIKLFDPYSGAKIFDTPVRGAHCLHKDCFDLEIFLHMCKREKPGWPTAADCWRCPICRGDVRPQTMVLDEFLLQVRQELASKDLLQTRAILVEADGSWKPKVEKQTGVRSPSLEGEERGTASVPHIARPSLPRAASSQKVIEVIELE